MTASTLTDAELARLEALAAKVCLPFETVIDLGVGCPSGNGPIPLRVCMARDTEAASYIAAACNAVPSLVAEVRRLRACKTISLCDIREQLESDQAKTITALRERVEALEWLVECMENYEWNCRGVGGFVPCGMHREARATLEAAREAIE